MARAEGFVGGEYERKGGGRVNQGKEDTAEKKRLERTEMERKGKAGRRSKRREKAKRQSK